jgi:hypothetical protein
MACTSVRGVSCKQTAFAAVTKRTRVVKVAAVKETSKPAAAFAAAAAAVLLASSPAFAAPLSAVNPAADVAAGPASKVKQAAKDVAGQGALAPDVEGQVRAGGAGRPGAAAKQKRTFVAASKEDQESAMDKYPVSEVNWRR